MQLSNPPSLRRISQNLIILSWLLFAIALILPAGKYTVEFINLPFGGSRPEPQEIYGWLVLQLNFSLDSVSSGTIVIESGHSLVSATPYRPDPCGFNC